MAEYKMVVFGAGFTGKSALTIQFVQGHFVEKYDATIEDVYKKLAEVDDKACTLMILDTAGQEEYVSKVNFFIDHGDGFLVVYNVTDRQSFEGARDVIANLVSAREEDLGPNSVSDGQLVPIMLVGNKVDLVNEQPSLREVDASEGKELAEQSRCGFYETSAKTRHNVEKAFHDLLRQIKKAQKRKQQAAQQAQHQQHHSSHAPPTSDAHAHKHRPGADEHAPEEKPEKKKKKRKCAIL